MALLKTGIYLSLKESNRHGAYIFYPLFMKRRLQNVWEKPVTPPYHKPGETERQLNKRGIALAKGGETEPGG